MITVAAKAIVWILLYLPPTQLPAYISVWSEYYTCEKKAVALREHFERIGDPHEFMCVQEGLRDIVDSDYGPENLPKRDYRGY